MGPTKTRARSGVRAAAAASLAAALGLLVGAGCGSEEVSDPSYLLVQLVPAASAPTKPGAARVVISAGGAEVAALCVNVTGEAGKPTASFVLKRDASKAASARITVTATSFELLKGQDTSQPGEEFACPAPPLPAALGQAQELSVDFCEAQSRKLVVHLGSVCPCAPAADAGAGGSGASCGCGEAQTCGAGISTDGRPCDDAMCCSRDVSAACALSPT